MNSTVTLQARVVVTKRLGKSIFLVRYRLRANYDEIRYGCVILFTGFVGCLTIRLSATENQRWIVQRLGYLAPAGARQQFLALGAVA
jgi:hypothetical protein